MQPGNQFPCGVEFVLFLSCGRRRVGAGSKSTARSAGDFLPRCLLRRDEFDYVGDEEVAGYAEEEGNSEEEVLSAVVVAADAYENSVLNKKLIKLVNWFLRN